MADEKVIAKVDPSGNPVNFSGLGTNILDGRGGFDCPNTPSDCDRVSTNGFGVGTGGYDPGKVVAVDQTDGPHSGYIYVRNSKPSGGEVDVFDPTGRFKGKVDEAQAFPRNNDGESAGGGISLSSVGQLFIGHACCGPGSIDIYGPAADGIPSHMPFIGQIRNAWQEPIEFLNASYSEIVGDTEFIYASGTAVSTWAKYPKSEALKPANPSVPIDHSPTQCRCGADSGPFLNGGSGFTTGALDPANRHVYLAADDFAGETIQEWDAENHKVGPDFATNNIPRSVGIQNFAFDRSGGPNDGMIYVIGSPGQIAKFGPPVVIPDLTYGDATPLHTTAHVEAAVDPLGAGDVTECKVEYGTDLTYGSSVPCAPATPYKGETDVSGDISGLSVEGDYHYRFVVKNGNGTNPGPDRTFHTFAVLDAVTDPATEVDRTGATLNGRLNPDGIPTTYHFEYGIDTAYRQDTPDVSAGAGSGQAAVAPAEIENLQPGRTYHFRLVAENALGTTYGNDQTFTAASSPTISGVYPTEVTETSAVLHASLDTYESDTTYRFEYGPTAEYGSVAPVPDGQIAGSDSRQDVQVQLNGLVSGSTYFFRVVATNQWGTTVGLNATFTFFPPNCPNSHIRQTTASNYLPDCRAYELVSPGDAGAVSLLPGDVSSGKYKATLLDIVTNPLFKPARARTRAAWRATRRGSPFSGAIGAVAGTNPPNTLLDRYVATRTSSGWKTTYPGLTGDETVLDGRPNATTRWTSASTTTPETRSGRAHSLQTPTPHVWSAGRQSSGAGRPTSTSSRNREIHQRRRTVPATSSPLAATSATTSSPRGTWSSPPAESAAPRARPTTTTSRSGRSRWSRCSRTATTSRQDAGSAKSSSGAGRLRRRLAHPDVDRRARGNHAPLHAGRRRRHLRRLAGPRRQFVGMIEGRDKVVFISKSTSRPTTPTSASTCSMWSEDADTLTRVSQGNGNGDTDACNAGWTSGCGGRSDRRRTTRLDNPIAPRSGDVYFYSPEQLDPDNPGVLNERNLYVFRDGEVAVRRHPRPRARVDRSQISPDGSSRRLPHRRAPDRLRQRGLATRCTSTTPRPGPSAARPASRAARRRRSCGRTRPNRLGHHHADVLASQSGRFMTDDGRVAFATADALVAAGHQRHGRRLRVRRRPPAADLSGHRPARHATPATRSIPAAYTGLEAFSARRRRHLLLDLRHARPAGPQRAVHQVLRRAHQRRLPGRPPPLLPCVAADECHGEGSATPAEPQDRHRGRPRSRRQRTGGAGRKNKKRKRHGRRRRTKKRRRSTGPGTAMPDARLERQAIDTAERRDGDDSEQGSEVARGGDARRLGRGRRPRLRSALGVGRGPRLHRDQLLQHRAVRHPGRRASGRGNPRDLRQPGQRRRGTRHPLPGGCECDDRETIDIHFPTGFIGNPHAVPSCTLALFALQSCAPESQVGVLATSALFGGYTPIYNMEPAPRRAGPARVQRPGPRRPVFIVLHARTDSDYGLDATTRRHLPPARRSTSSTSGCGACPSLPVHDNDPVPVGSSSGACRRHYPEPCYPPVTSNSPPTPFLQNPTTCGMPLTASLDDRLLRRHRRARRSDLAGDHRLRPAQLQPEPHGACRRRPPPTPPSGLDVDLKVPQSQSPTVPRPRRSARRP